MAWPEKRPHGYVMRWIDADGAKRTSPAYPNRPACMAAIRAFHAQHPPRRGRRKAGPRPAEPLTIAQLAALWKQAQEANEARMRRPGAATYLTTATDTAKQAAAQLGWERPGDATVDSVERWRLSRQHRGVNRPSAYLRAILRWGRDRHGTALDGQVYAALRPPQSRRAQRDRLSDDQLAIVLQRAQEWGCWALFACLSTYGWRPITACRIRVGWLRRDAIQIDVKHGGEPHVHPLFPFHAERLRALADKRDPDELLFLDPRTDKPWPISTRGSASALQRFYRDHLQPDDSRACGDIYALKRLALSRMAAGDKPWSKPLALAQIRLFTGHKADAMVLRYLATNHAEARSVMGNDAPQLPPRKRKKKRK